MAKKTNRRMVKKSLKHHIKTYNFFLIFATLLGMIAGVLLVKMLYIEPQVNNQPSINLGIIQYDISNGKATKRDTPAVSSLRSFLTKEAAKDCKAIHSDDKPTQYQVIAANAAASQVLLGYGCGDTSAHMFAVRQGESWHFISPTNHFDPLYGIPECSYVKDNSIDKIIAPVCYQIKKQTVHYSVR